MDRQRRHRLQAKTARFFDAHQPNWRTLPARRDAYGIENSNGRLISFPGGLPITNDQGGDWRWRVGASVEDDHTVAAARLDAACQTCES